MSLCISNMMSVCIQLCEVIHDFHHQSMKDQFDQWNALFMVCIIKNDKVILIVISPLFVTIPVKFNVFAIKLCILHIICMSYDKKTLTSTAKSGSDFRKELKFLPN